MLLHFLAAMLGVWAFAVLFHTPPKYYLACAFTGAVGWVSYLSLTALGCGLAVSTIVSVVILTLMSRAFAVVQKAPATTFLVTGIFPLVPGAGIYYTAYYIIQQDFVTGGAKAVEIFAFAGSIALGILIGSMVPQSWFLRLLGYCSSQKSSKETLTKTGKF
jgi:uncharacterized membrane protein YjjB (DUF3815 family)